MVAGLLIRGVILAAGFFAVGAMLLTALHFIRRPEYVKARVFLNYPRFSRRFLLVILFAFVAESFTWLYTLAGGAPAPAFESWGGFFQTQSLTMVVAAAMGGGMVWLWRVVR